MWTIKWSALFHYYQNKKPEFDKAFVRGRKRNLRGHHLFHIGFPPPSSHWNLYGYIYIYIFYHGFKSFIWHMHIHLLTPYLNVSLSMSRRQWESILSFHGMKFVNTPQINWFSWSCYYFAFMFGFMIQKKKIYIYIY